MSESYPAFRRSMQGLIGRGGKILATDDNAPRRTVTEHPLSSLGRRYQDQSGKVYHVDSLAYHTKGGKDGRMHYHVDGIGPGGRIKENPTGENGFINHSQVKDNVESSKWNYHSATRGFEPGGQYESSGYKEGPEE